MENILSALSPGLIIRSTLAGGFFVFSFAIAVGSSPENLEGLGNKSVTLEVLALCVFSGFTAYAIHRAMIFPIIEWIINHKYAKACRECCPLITESVVTHLFDQWELSAECEDDLSVKRARYDHIKTWADQIHFLYASGLAIILGGWAGCIWRNTVLSPCGPLVYFCVFLYVCGLFSNWRLLRVRDKLFGYTTDQTAS